MIDDLYCGNIIGLESLKIYLLYNTETLQKDTPQERLRWLRAPVICKTNRERVTINFIRARKFAQATGTVVIRWMAKFGNWEGQPEDGDDIQEVMRTDPAFYELFVFDANCFLTDTISKTKKLCNGSRAKYHSLVLSHDQEIELNEGLKNATAGDIVTLSQPPLAINVLIEDVNVTANAKVNWKIQSLDKTKVIVPIRPYSADQDASRMVSTKPIALKAPSLLTTPSRVTILTHFPLVGAFSMTVERSQGQTIDRVIVALSKRKLGITDFQYACLYVALSRVQHRTHLRILLMDEENADVAWQSLMYINNLRRDKSIKFFFSGFDSDRTNWTRDEWNSEQALDVINDKKNIH